MKTRLFSLFLLCLLFLSIPNTAWAQTYRFNLDEETLHVYWSEQGFVALDYTFKFTNSLSADALDVVDVGTPNTNYDLNSVVADVDGKPLTRIENSPYVTGVAVYLDEKAIPPGKSGSVHVRIGRVNKVLYPDDKDKDYVSAVVSPTWFGSEYVNSDTNLTVVYHLPAGVQPDEPRWHAAPSGFPSQPETSLDEEGRVTYTWNNPNARPDKQYKFGASFPAKYVPESAVTRPDPFEPLYAFIGAVLAMSPCFLTIGIFVLVIFFSAWNARRRSMKYLPPSISIEGHGIKRGLTPVEAAVLMEQPMDKILSLILFSVLKKGAAQVTTREPLQIQASDPLPEGLYQYEEQFLAAFSKDKDKREQRKALQNMMVDLVKSLSAKMKGFSRKETATYYKSIMDKAWQQVEAADTPEVKSAKFDEGMEWTMLDKNFEGRTREVFRTQPVFVPSWWWRYDPAWSHSGSGTPRSGGQAVPTPSQSSSGGGGMSMPTLPGADFAAGMVLGAQNFANSVVGNVSDFTSRVTNVTNPPPPPSRSGGRSGGGGGCACACACAGCACACAGGGR